jgi:hypothetical protein
MIDRLPEHEEAAPIVIIQLVMNMTYKMSLVKTEHEFEYLCNVSLDLCDVYREATGNYGEVIQTSFPMPIGNRDMFIGVTVSRFMTRQIAKVMMQVPPADHHLVAKAVSESLIGTVLMEKLKDGSYFTDEVYDQQLRYENEKIILAPADGEDTAPIVLPPQDDEEWPEMISNNEN